jgi:hypothetical protein
VTAVRFTPVSRFVTDICAPTIAAPDGSVTVPESLAPVTCARAWPKA